MKESEKLASKFLEEKLKDLGTSIPQYKHLTISLMIKFAREMCEQQKQLCYKNVDENSIHPKNFGVIKVSLDRNLESIVNSKNVCDI